jgi:hypothetical protein
MANKNLLTIITIVKNDYVNLNLTVDSVVRSGMSCEHLIIDGSHVDPGCLL